MITATSAITAISSRVRPPLCASADSPPERLTPPPSLAVSFLLNVGMGSSSAKSLLRFRVASRDHRMIGGCAALAVDAPLDLHDASDELRFRLDGDRARARYVDFI